MPFFVYSRRSAFSDVHLYACVLFYLHTNGSHASTSQLHLAAMRMPKHPLSSLLPWLNIHVTIAMVIHMMFIFLHVCLNHANVCGDKG